MAINGHKKRALLRRGIEVQESLKRRMNLTESASIRRNLTEEVELVKLNKLCGDDIEAGVVDSVYCRLSNLLNEVPPDLVGEIHKALDDIYTFYRDRITTDNRTLFRKTAEVILKNENPGTAFKLVAAYLNDSSIDVIEKVTRLRSFIKHGGEVEEDELEDYLRQARHVEYTKYENSFVGDNFDLLRGHIKFSHGHDESAFYKIVIGVLTKKYTLDQVVKTITKTILETPIEGLVGKADLILKVDLISEDEEPILYKGDPIEVKKMDYKTDSYFSEFFAIYKTPTNFSEYINNSQFRDVYNTIIDGVYVELKTKGDHLLDEVWNSVKAIIYENNRIIKMDDIDLYWSNQGQRGCDDHRLTIRYRLNKANVMSYIYNSSGVVKSEPVSVIYSQTEKFCPIFSEELYRGISTI